MASISGRKVFSASSLTGMAVRNAAGEDLGEIKDVVLDVESGRIAYAVLSFGGFLGLGDKYFAIPWGALNLSIEQTFILNVPREKLETAPGFDKENWPDMAESQWESVIHSYYGSRPYWENK
ncbi:MAG TPA: PRC-barrel domain-containing protein [Nitrospiraceae bacterium]|nr:PRC-barrel domain-containing protein [Nitrospiraceae bacterium]